jgi:hypothetical protein
MLRWASFLTWMTLCACFASQMWTNYVMYDEVGSLNAWNDVLYMRLFFMLALTTGLLAVRSDPTSALVSAAVGIRLLHRGWDSVIYIVPDIWSLSYPAFCIAFLTASGLLRHMLPVLPFGAVVRAAVSVVLAWAICTQSWFIRILVASGPVVALMLLGAAEILIHKAFTMRSSTNTSEFPVHAFGSTGLTINV